MKLPITHSGLWTPPIGGKRVAGGFSLIEVLVVIVILGLIVLVLMSVFGSTQRAFRASVTQTDVLQGGRAAVELISADLRTAAPCDGPSVGTGNPFLAGGFVFNGINFFVTNNAGSYVPLTLSLPGSTLMRTNLLQMFFVLGRQNTKWTGVGYFVNNASTASLYPLYRFYAETNTSASPANLFNIFIGTVANDVAANNFTNLSHVMDGVLHLVVRGYDVNGILMTNGYSPAMMIATNPVQNTWFTPPYPAAGGEVGFAMSSNAVPATVELQMAVLEDRALQRATSLATGNPPAPGNPQWNYLQAQSGHVHVFRERVTIENLDPAAYQ